MNTSSSSMLFGFYLPTALLRQGGITANGIFIKQHGVFVNARSEKAAFHGSLSRMSVVSRPRRAGRASSIKRAGSLSRGQSLPRLPRSYMLIPANESESSGASAAARQRHAVSGLLQGEFYRRLKCDVIRGDRRLVASRDQQLYQQWSNDVL